MSCTLVVTNSLEKCSMLFCLHLWRKGLWHTDYNMLDVIRYPKSRFDHFPKMYSFLCSVFGTIGNVLSGIVMTRKSMRSNTMALMLTVLAMVETGVLWVDMLRNYNSNSNFPHVTTLNITLFTPQRFKCLVNRIICTYTIWQPFQLKSVLLYYRLF